MHRRAFFRGPHNPRLDPVELVQNSFAGARVTAGVTTAHISPSGVVIGGQFGCDYQFAAKRGRCNRSDAPSSATRSALTASAAASGPSH
jgi:hypothetical protein